MATLKQGKPWRRRGRDRILSTDAVAKKQLNIFKTMWKARETVGYSETQCVLYI